MDKLSEDLNKVTQVCMTAQENTSKLIISLVLARPQDSPHTTTEANPPRESRTFISN